MTTDTAAPARLWEGSPADGHQRSTPTLPYTLYPGCTRLDSGQQYFFPELFFLGNPDSFNSGEFPGIYPFFRKTRKTEFFGTCMKKEVFSDTRVQDSPPLFLLLLPPTFHQRYGGI
jgi:hypothetical protein